MDIGNLVDYEAIFKLELKNPATKKKLGITFDLTSSNSDAVKAVIRKQVDARLQDQSEATPTVEEGEVMTVNRVAASVVGWDWGEHDYNGEKLDFTHSNVVKVLSGVDWIFAQVNVEVSKIKNFTAA